MAKHAKNAMYAMFTGKDNETLDLGRILWAMSVVAFLVICIYSLYKEMQVEYLALGTGLAAVLAAGGAAIGLKSNTEPTDDSDSNKPKG
jgi:hypothetical protein